MNKDIFMQVCAHILQKDVSLVSLDDNLTSVGWDSLANVEFIAEIDDQFGVTLGSESLADCETIGELFNLINKQVGN
ncbi:acyl carrier protein [Aurantimicrobium minutum]|uniref:acyl carrier protein n=1 Tax=Aurantimicrobium minutum TaxID=708131 RepID=UPI00247536DA|nr:acyl carrier protein [Aurantimicrobium minutum]MDH6533347.1 acyl carrier protein [Aurantimicrobium minutum]